MFTQILREAPREPATPESVKRRQAIAEALAERANSFAPVQHWTQGAARVAQAIAAMRQQQFADEDAAAGRAAAAAEFAALMGIAAPGAGGGVGGGAPAGQPEPRVMTASLGGQPVAMPPRPPAPIPTAPQSAPVTRAPASPFDAPPAITFDGRPKETVPLPMQDLPPAVVAGTRPSAYAAAMPPQSSVIPGPAPAMTDPSFDPFVTGRTPAPQAGQTMQLSNIAPQPDNMRLPAAIRHNNPGAMWPGPSSRRFGSTGFQMLNDGLGQGNRIATFPTPEHGGAALFDLLDRRYTNKTLADAIAKWSGGNSSSAYAARVARETGIDPNAPITADMLRDPAVAIPLARAMAGHEAGRPYPMPEGGWDRAHTKFLSGGPVQMADASGGVPSAPGVAAAPQGIDPQLRSAIQMLNNPWATPGQRMVAQTLFERAMGANDPRRALEAEKLRQDIARGAPDFMSAADRARIDLDRQRLEMERQKVAAPKDQPNDVREYQFAVDQMRQRGTPDADIPSFTDWSISQRRAGASSINVGGGTDKQVFEAMNESATSARSAVQGLTSIAEARRAIEAGGIFGAGADARLGLQKVAALMGVGDASKIVNTETFRAAIAPQVAAVMKATVGNVQISNADREFAERAAGGSISLDEGSIKRLLGIMERASRASVEGHMDRLNKVYPDGKGFDRERALFGVSMPSTSAGAGGAPSPGTVVDGYRFKGGNPADPASWEKVR